MKKILLAVFLLCGGEAFAQTAIIPVLVNQSTAAKRTVCFILISSADLSSPATGEAGGQPQISTGTGAYTDTGIGPLSATDATHGKYCSAVTQAAVSTLGVIIHTRYKSTNTAEATGEALRVVADDPDLAKPFGVKAGAGFRYPLQFYTSAGALVVTGTPVCTIGIDTITPASFVATHNTPSAVNAFGFSIITFDAVDMAAVDFVELHCTLTNARDFWLTFKTQAVQ